MNAEARSQAEAAVTAHAGQPKGAGPYANPAKLHERDMAPMSYADTLRYLWRRVLAGSALLLVVIAVALAWAWNERVALGEKVTDGFIAAAGITLEQAVFEQREELLTSIAQGKAQTTAAENLRWLMPLDPHSHVWTALLEMPDAPQRSVLAYRPPGLALTGAYAYTPLALELIEKLWRSLPEAGTLEWKSETGHSILIIPGGALRGPILRARYTSEALPGLKLDLTRSASIHIKIWNLTLALALLCWAAGTGVAVWLATSRGRVQRLLAQTLADLKDLAGLVIESPLPMWRLDKDGRLHDANPAATRLRQSLECDEGRGQGHWRAALQRIAEVDGSAAAWEMQLGDEWYRLHVAPAADTGMANIYGKLITERKLAEFARESQFRQTEFLLALCSGIAEQLAPQELTDLLGENARRIGFADHCEVLLEGEQGLAHVGGSALPIQDERTEAIDWEGLEASLRMRGLTHQFRCPVFRDAQGESFLLVARSAAPFDHGEESFLIRLAQQLGVGLRQAQLREALEDAFKDLRRRQERDLENQHLRSLGRLAREVAHDINNALSPVALYVERLIEAEQGLSEKGRQRLRQIQSALEDVAITVERMRNSYSSPDLPVRAQKVNVVATLQRLATERAAHQHGAVQLQWDAPASPAFVHVDPEALEKSLAQLLDNACEAMPKGGELRVGVQWEPQRVCIEIRDSGLGMDRNTLRLCREPFFSTKDARGSGLGLAIVQAFAEQCGGSLEIHSEPGKGTLVQLCLPSGTVAPGLSSGSLLSDNGLRTPTAAAPQDESTGTAADH